MVGLAECLGDACRISALDYAGGTLLATGPDGALLLWRRDEEGWVVVADVPSGGARWAGGLSPDGAGVYVSDDAVVQSAPIRKRLRALSPFCTAPAQVRSLAWSPGGETLLVTTGSSSLALDWTGAPRWDRDGVGPLVWGQNGAVVAGTDTGVDWIDGMTGDVKRSIILDAAPRVLAVSADGLLAVSWGDGTGGALGAVRILGRRGAVDCDVSGLHGVEAMEWSPRSDRLAAVCSDGEVVVWRSTGRRECSGRGRHRSLSAIVWLDEETFAVAGESEVDGPAIALFGMS